MYNADRPQRVATDMIEQHESLIQSEARRVCNGVLTVQDVAQELRAKVASVIRRGIEEGKPENLRIDDPEGLAEACRTIIKNKAEDLVRYYSRRKDTSKYRPSATTAREVGHEANRGQSEWCQEVQDSSGETFLRTFHIPQSEADQTEQAIRQDFIDRVRDRLQQLGERYEGVLEFFEEAVDPSQETAEAFYEYRDNCKSPRNMKDGYIPPTVLAKLLGYSSRDCRKFREIISQVMGNLKVGRAREIHVDLAKQNPWNGEV